jgi:hypothetical protein
VREFSPEERRLFDDQGTSLFEEAAARGMLRDDDPRIAEGGDLRRAFDLLVRVGLLMRDEQDEGWVPTDPAPVQSRVVGPLSQRGADLLAESSHWATTFAHLGQTWRRSPRSARGPFTELRGRDVIGSFIESVVVDAEHELLTAQPQTGRSAQTLVAARERDFAALERGVRMRTLYQHSARRSSVTHQYVADVTRRGAEVRTLDEFFNRLIVVDRRIAVIPHHEGLDAALAVRESSMVAYLVDMFERTWERARPFTNRETSMIKDIAAEQRAMTIRMLIEGHADPASAKRLGVSPRTYAGYVADLKDEFDAETRFQLGYSLGTRGISGHERAD